MHSSYNPNSGAALLSIGILDSISAGILLYAGLVELLYHDVRSSLSSEENRSSSRVAVHARRVGDGQDESRSRCRPRCSCWNALHGALLLIFFPFVANAQLSQSVLGKWA